MCTCVLDCTVVLYSNVMTMMIYSKFLYSDTYGDSLMQTTANITQTLG